MVNIIVIAILIIPWLIVPINNIPDCTRLIKGAFFDFTMFGIIIVALINGLKFEYKNKYISWFASWVFLTIIFNWYYPIIMGIGYNVGSIDSNIHFILAITGTILVCSNFERSDFIRCAKAFCISGTLVSIFCIFQGVGLDPMAHIAKYGYKESRHIGALLDNPDIVGNYLCMLLPFFVYFNKPKYYICLGLCVWALLLSQSSISIVAAFISMAIYLLFRFPGKRIVVISVLISTLFFGIFCITNHHFNKIDNGFTGRFRAWETMLSRTNNPLFGQGLGIVKSLSVKSEIDNIWIYAHNDYLETYISLGALGLFLLILIIFNAFKKFNYKLDNQAGFAYLSSFVAFLIIMLASFPMEMPPLALDGLVVFWAVSKI